MFRSIAASVLATLMLSTVPVAAAARAGASSEPVAPSRAVAALVTLPVAAQTSLLGVSADALAVVPSTDAIVAPLTPIRLSAAARPSVLPSMYVSLAALQGYDAYSTLRLVKQGAVEANPIMAGTVGNPAAFIAMKIGVTVASIYAAEHLWKSGHRVKAIAMIAVTNGLMTAVAVNNANVMRRMR